MPSRPLVSLLLVLPLSAAAADSVRFNRDIRPVLSDKCFHCHGPDEKERKADLRLDLREAAIKGGKSGHPGIDLQKPENSEVLRRVLTTDEDDLMPPADLHKPVTPAEADLLRRWITEGAPYEGHWAFIPPVAESPPPGGRNPIDGFLLRTLQKQGLAFSPETSRQSLIRRVTLDLTGLPPSLAEIDAFLNDPAPDAYEKLVDRLLASPRYGEHMAARWLDLARYADSNGFQTDSSRTMWPWRDWVINAFNRNLPFDQFTIQQLAGDLLPDPTRDQLVATGFNRNTRLNGEGGRIAEEWFAETVIDRVETTGLTWMALTLNCCRCHDHKYDPISQKEFYQFFAWFNSNEESGVLDAEGGNRGGGNSSPVLPLPAPEDEAKLKELDNSVRVAQDAVAAARKELPALQTPWEESLRATLAASPQPWRSLDNESAKSLGGATLTRQPDASWLAGGTNAPHDTYEIEAPLAPGTFSGVLIEVFPDASLPNQSLGRGFNGNFVLSGVEAEIIPAPGSDPIAADFTRAGADYEQPGFSVTAIVKDQPRPVKGKRRPAAPKNQTGWAVDGNSEDKRLPRKAFFACEPVAVPEGARVRIRLRHSSAHGDHNVGRFRLSTTSLPTAAITVDGASIPADLRTTLETPAATRSPQQKQALAKYFLENGEHPLRAAEDRLAATRKALSDLQDNFVTTMIFKERKEPRQAVVLKRGEYDKPGDPVPRALPAVLPPLPEGAPVNRLGFARWLVSGQHPLTARVWVNRAWERFFGQGLVRTTENFGSQAEWPSHPDLLDWLAVEFVRVGWDMKAMQRLMVTSAAYRQDSKVTPDLLERDPDNRWLARAPRLRLAAEVLRDQALAISGLLVDKTGGPSVRPYMPAAVWDETSVYGDLRNYKADSGEGLYRRSLYTIWKRTAAPPTMLLFDTPNREICTVKRSRTNTPLQALALLNEVTWVEAARRLAERMLTDGGTTPEARITWAFRAVTARQPDAAELAALTKGLGSRLAAFQQHPEDAAALISQGSSPPVKGLDPAELAAHTVTANILLNLDESVTRN